MEVHMEGEGTKQIQIFTWLALQLKLPSADRIIKQGRQANPICALCRTTDESHMYMFAKCTYTKAVWQSIAQWLNLQLPPQNVASMRRWWHTVTQGGTAQPHQGLGAAD
jgi:hypothetical protein